MNLDRVVLCRPQGGLNDVLCQIELICRYAQRFNRTVIVDTNYHSSRFIRDRFSRYFVSRQDNLMLHIDAIDLRLERVTTFPEFISGRVNDYEVLYTEDGHVEKLSRRPVSFDFSKDYAETLLVHHRAGSTPGASLAALSRLRLADDVSTDLVNRLNIINAPYTAIHIRNTDYTTNYQSLLSQLSTRPILLDCKHLFVATDNITCLEYCRSVLPEIRIHSFTKFPNQVGQPLHRLSADDNVYDRNKDAILDLLMLALADRLILLKIDPNQFGVRVSGFSRLARALQGDRATLSSLIANPVVRV